MPIRPMYSNVESIGKFSEWLSKQMKFHGMTITRLAKLSGVHPNTIRNYLAERCEPTLFNAQCIINAFGYELGAIKL